MAIKANLLIDQGCTFATSVTVTDQEGAPIDLTGFTGQGQLRKHYSSATPAANLTIQITPFEGLVSLSLTANQTANVVAGRYVYDVELTDTYGVVSRIVEGIATVTPQVTRS